MEFSNTSLAQSSQMWWQKNKSVRYSYFMHPKYVYYAYKVPARTSLVYAL